ncbi:MAG: hypothetical protein IIB82_11955 [Bacteroidetes bacterium]|nr:hypothetical protein [Bacteroidota bacterium]
MTRLLIFTALFLFVFAFSKSQDRTQYEGKVISETKQILKKSGDKTETKTDSVKTTIHFNAKSITINKDVYEIVNKEFDGIDLTSFMCTMRRSNYKIEYIIDTSITVIEVSNPDVEIVYLDLTEE